MTPYRPPGSKRWWVTLTTQDGRYVRLPTRTRDATTASQMQSMVTALQGTGKRWWDVVQHLDAHRHDLPRVFDHWVSNTMNELREQLADVDLAPGLEAWETSIRRELSAETVRAYLRHAKVSFPKTDEKWDAAPRSRVMKAGFFKKALGAVEKSNTNRARHFAAWSSVVRFLLSRGDLERNPLDGLTQPTSNASPRDRYIDSLADVQKLLEAFPEGPHRALAALREGAGVEISGGLRARRADVEDETHGVVFIHGTKNRYRARQVVVDSWAWSKYLWPYIQQGAFTPHALLFPVRERDHRDVHNEACKALREKGVAIPATYTLHNARNTYTVRRLRAGDDPRLIAENLGHADERMILSVYGQRRPKVLEMVTAKNRKNG